jgi:glycine oxidase
VYQLLRDAQQLLPAVAELELLEATARARPATPDNAPLLGRVADRAAGRPGDVAGIIVATGFFRHGILLTPVAAQICRQLLEGTADPRWSRFRPDRFSAGAPDPSPHDPSPHDPSPHDPSPHPERSKEAL